MRSEYVRVFRAFTDENRIRILEILSEGEQCALRLAGRAENQSTDALIPHENFCESGIIKAAGGKWNYYSINADGCEYASRLLNAIVKHNIEGTLRVVRFAYRFLRCFDASLYEHRRYRLRDLRYA